MDGLLVILIIIFFAVQSKKKKDAKAKGRAEKSVAAKRMAPIDKAIKSGFGEMKEFMDDIEEVIKEAASDDEDEGFTAPAKLPARKMKAAPAKKISDVPGLNVQLKMDMPAGSAGKPMGIPEGEKTHVFSSLQGKSLRDDQGCIGGSLPHIQHEGETRDEHGDHMRRAREAERAAILSEEVAGELHSMNVQKLRRAIVISEILDKPVALRRR